ncbi:hypothetical protein FA95DRAFT_284035 [Auriscalpium vulgare]|uniref:Uncharacterized protein n=1 Tax=Auriscalpium vulgare TaxID=40419 RepID=A0ACB8S5Q4_9AGAM|nr:hypothetical protein FA95DRAFT_284035 [Auriscalpium vulgare]
MARETPASLPDEEDFFYNATAMALLSARPMQSSPSVAIEKGAYRLHGRTLRRTRLQEVSPLRMGSTGSTVSETSRASIRHERHVTLLLVVLAVAAITSFGLAWILSVKGKRVTKADQRCTKPRLFPRFLREAMSAGPRPSFASTFSTMKTR